MAQRADSNGLPPVQHLRAVHVIDAMATFGQDRLERLGLPRAFLLAALAGGFITLGGLLSILLPVGIRSKPLPNAPNIVGFTESLTAELLAEHSGVRLGAVHLPGCTPLSSCGAGTSCRVARNLSRRLPARGRRRRPRQPVGAARPGSRPRLALSFDDQAHQIRQLQVLSRNRGKVAAGLAMAATAAATAFAGIRGPDRHEEE